MKRAAVRWAPALAWAAAIFWLSSRSQLAALPGPFGWDKLQHTAAYLAGGLLLARAAGLRGRLPLLAVALGLLYAVSDEVHQAFVPGRSPDVRDWVADAAGVVAGVIIYRLYIRRRERRGTPAVAARAGAVGT